MAKIIFPKTQIGTGGILRDLSFDIVQYANPTVSQNNGDVVYEIPDPSLLYDLMSHDNLMLLVNNGGEIENYTMYAECSDTIYNTEVPEGLPHRTMKVISSGALVSPTPVKKFSQWCNYNLIQTFKSDHTKLYVTTSPHGAPLKGSELKIMVDGFGVKLLSIKEYNTKKAAGEIID
jgi:hypothetical protein